MERKIENQVVLYYLRRIIDSGFFRLAGNNAQEHFGSWLESHPDILSHVGVLPWRKDEGTPVDHACLAELGGSENHIAPCCSGGLTGEPGNSETASSETVGSQSLQDEAPMPELEAVAKVCEWFDIPVEERPLFELCYCLDNSPCLAGLFRTLGGLVGGGGGLFAAALNVSENELQRMGMVANPLVRKGLVVRDNKKGEFHLAEGIRSLLASPSECASPGEYCEAYLGKPLESDYQAKDFFYCKEFGNALELLKCALARKTRGVNILVYGSAGTGKTELVKTLCHEAGAILYEFPTIADGEGDCPCATSALRTATLLGKGENTVLLVKGARSMMGGGFRGLGDASDNSRLNLMKELMETTPVPIIWIDTNTGWLRNDGPPFSTRPGISNSILSLFSMAIPVAFLSNSQVPEAFRLIAERERVEIGEDDVAVLRRKAKRIRMTPGMVRRTLETYRMTSSVLLAGQTISSFRCMTEGVSSDRGFDFPSFFCAGARPAKKGDQLETGFDPKDFSVELVNATPSLVKLADRLADEKCSKRFSLCLFGVPGSGKSAYARYLADRLGMKVLQKRTSDILNCWVGETERKIAEAFKEARARNMILVFDEADSLLRNRQLAMRSWEVTKVNEMLTQMETHPLPFICTTNLMSDIDPASLRRFTFKVRYGYMTLDQVALAFQHFFNRPVEGGYSDLTELSPGDFATVKRKAEALGLDSTEDLLEMLHEEQDVKGGSDHSRIGFVC